jgi:ParB family chromosome partitioning protein
LKDDLAALRQGKLSPLKEARIYEALLRDGRVKTQRALAGLVGVSQPRICQRMALLTLPADVIATMDDPILARRFTERHAREIRRLGDPRQQSRLARKVIKDNLTVEETAALVTSVSGQPRRKGANAWTSGPGYRWRTRGSWLEVRIHASNHARRLAILSKLTVELRTN